MDRPHPSYHSGVGAAPAANNFTHYVRRLSASAYRPHTPMLQAQSTLRQKLLKLVL